MGEAMSSVVTLLDILGERLSGVNQQMAFAVHGEIVTGVIVPYSINSHAQRKFAVF